MAVTKKEFWIDVEPENAEMQKRLHAVLNIGYEVYEWALDMAIDIWVREKEISKVGTLSKELTQRIRNSPWYGNIQRYTLNRVVESAISQFSRELKISDEGMVVFPTRIEKREYNSFIIPTRGIWKKYLEDFGRISTAYGMLYMLGDWIEIMQSQAKYNKITMEQLPYLWYSISMRKHEDKWQIQFNLHKTTSHQGKIAERRMKRERLRAL